MQDHLDQLLVEPGHTDQIARVLRVWTKERGPDRRLPANPGQRLPDALVGQRRLGLGWDGSRKGDVRHTSRGAGEWAGRHWGRRDHRDPTSEASANLRRIDLVLDLLQLADDPAHPVETGPLGQSCGRGVGARGRQGATDRPAQPQAVSYTHLTLPTNREV